MLVYSLVINGITEDIASVPEYHEAMLHEIERVLSQGNIVFGKNSTVLEIAPESIFKDLTPSESARNKVLEKIS